MDDQHVRALIETVYRADFNTICVFALYAVLSDDKCHRYFRSVQKRAILADA